MSLGQFRSHEQQFKEGKFEIILRAEESPRWPGARTCLRSIDYAKTEEQRAVDALHLLLTEFGRPYMFPPDVPKDRVAVHAQGHRSAR